MRKEIADNDTSMSDPTSNPAATPAQYADLAKLEYAFNEIDAATTVYQHLLSRETYAKRSRLVRSIPNFWPLVFEQSPLDVDCFIQPSDSAVFASCLKSLHVERFEIPGNVTPPSRIDAEGKRACFGPEVEPRSVRIAFEFGENEWFEDTLLEKKFYYRYSRDAWEGRVSEPVRIRWKKGKDLSEGLTDAACALWEAEKKAGLLNFKGNNAPTSDAAQRKAQIKKDAEERQRKRETLPEYKSLVQRIENSSEGGLSFFAWFAFRGEHSFVSAEESAVAKKEEAEQRAKDSDDDEEEEDDDEGDEDKTSDAADDEDIVLKTEVFPQGDDLALALTEDIWPNALQYFIQAQDEEFDDEQLSSVEDEDMEDDEEEEEDVMDIGDELRGKQPNKKRKA
ncbi:MAG: hypothetical protein M1831_001247 [Alyxoria varia]|nr:MAG: hypothetical protein M1831_001247 [Alyxoria varia]